MLVIGFLQWWYGAGWKEAGQRMMSRIKNTYAYFSIPTLLRTLFLPWRRIMSYSDGSLQQRLQAMMDNLVSRFVGFSIRIIMLFIGLLAIVFTFILGGIMIAIWPIMPIASLLLLVRGLLP